MTAVRWRRTTLLHAAGSNRGLTNTVSHDDPLFQRPSSMQAVRVFPPSWAPVSRASGLVVSISLMRLVKGQSGKPRKSNLEVQIEVDMDIAWGEFHRCGFLLPSTPLWVLFFSPFGNVLPVYLYIFPFWFSKAWIMQVHLLWLLSLAQRCLGNAESINEWFSKTPLPPLWPPHLCARNPGGGARLGRHVQTASGVSQTPLLLFCYGSGQEIESSLGYFKQKGIFWRTLGVYKIVGEPEAWGSRNESQLMGVVYVIMYKQTLAWLLKTTGSPRVPSPLRLCLELLSSRTNGR